MNNDKEDKYHAAAMQLNLLLSGTSMMHLQLTFFYHNGDFLLKHKI